MFLSASYGINFTDKGSGEFKKAEIIFQRCLSKHWSYQEFQDRLYAFIDTNKWINFTPAAFLAEFERPSLFGEAWKNAEKEKNINAIADMECYEMPDGTGQVVKMYRYKDPEHPVKGLTDIWAKQNIMKAYSYAAGDEPKEFTPSKATTDPDAPIDCAKFLEGFAKNLFSSGDYDKLSDSGKRFINEYLSIKKRQADLEGKNAPAV